MSNPVYEPMSVNAVSAYLKSKCPNFVVKHGFGSMYVQGQDIVSVNMQQDVQVSTMIGNLSHIINAGLGNYILAWPSRYDHDWRIIDECETVSLDILWEMRCTDQ